MNSTQHQLTVRQHYEEALTTMKAGDFDEAESICRRALPEFPGDPNIRCLLGEICLKQNRPQEAHNWFARVLKRHANYPRALEGRGLAWLATGKPEEAVDCLRKVAAAMPRRSNTRMALGRALTAAGHHAEARQAFEEAFALSPRKAALANAVEARQEGRIADAEKTVRQLLETDPEDATALRMLGNIALEVGRLNPATELLEKSVRLAPGFVPGWVDLATSYMKQDRYEEALERIDHAITMEPRLAHSHVMRGNILAKAQRHESALAAYREALDVSPKNGGALSGIGHVLKTIGRQEEAIATYRECIEAHPHFGEAYWSLANLKTFRFDEREVDVMKRAVQDPGLPDEARVNFHLALGKHYENEDCFDLAFENYRLGNQIRRQHEIYDPVHTEVVHDRIIDVFCEEFFRTRSGYGDPRPDPILIVGLPRSGSTLIEQILASHSQVEGTMELPDLGRIIGRLKGRGSHRREYPEAVGDLSQDAARELGRSYLESTRRYRSDKPFFIDKMPNNFSSIGFLHLILPNAKVINAGRHPLDSCMGCYKQLFYGGQSWTYDLVEIGEYYLQYLKIMEHWRAVLPGKVLDVRYEDMVSDQEGETRRILEHCGLDWEDRCLRFYETDRAINTASSEQVRQPIYRNSVNAWRNYEKHLGEMIETLEPALRDLPPEERPASM